MCSTDCSLHAFPSVKEATLQENESDLMFTSTSWRRRSHLSTENNDSLLLSNPADHASDLTTTSSNTSFQLRIPIGATWTVGKLSVFIVLVAFALDHGVCQLQRLKSPDMYKHKLTRVSLGSAAISSVTESLAPILPFTGGLDLRREDYWATSGTWLEKLQSVATQVQDAFSSQAVEEDDDDSRNDGNTSARQQAIISSKRKPVAQPLIISAQQPFVSIEVISKLTLSHVSETFRYAIEANKPGFNENKFMNNLSPRVKKVLVGMIAAVEKSRGKDTKLSTFDPDSFGQVDALLFCASMRIFAEWRVVRQVPEGYKGFAVGMNLGHKDIVQNVAKIESTAHALLNHRRDMFALESQWAANGADENCPIDGSTPRCMRSPTIQEVMQYEIDMDVNPASRLPRLKDKSGSMGILWTRRQLHYQTLLLDNVLKIPNKYVSTAAAVLAAYNEVYDQFHGWAVQKIFNYSFQSAPEAQEIFKHMNPHRLQEASLEARLHVGAKTGSEQGPLPSEREDEHPFATFVNHIGGEWNKIVTNVVKVFDKNHDAGGHGSMRGDGEHVDASAVDEFVVQAMVKDAYERIPAYLQIVYPLLDDLALTFKKLNMDDPSRV
jgi:hypothetical protein